MYKASVLTDYFTDEQGSHPSLVRDYSLASTILLHASGSIPSNPNLATLGIVCDQATLDLIEADEKYNVLSSEEIIDETI